MAEIEKLSDDQLLADFAALVGKVMQRHAAEIKALKAEVAEWSRALRDDVGLPLAPPAPDPEAEARAVRDIQELEKLFGGEGETHV